MYSQRDLNIHYYIVILYIYIILQGYYKNLKILNTVLYTYTILILYTKYSINIRIPLENSTSAKCVYTKIFQKDMALAYLIKVTAAKEIIAKL